VQGTHAGRGGTPVLLVDASGHAQALVRGDRRNTRRCMAADHVSASLAQL